jgi:hypothetical protein
VLASTRQVELDCKIRAVTKETVSKEAGRQVEALDRKFKDVITVATIKDIQGSKVWTSRAGQQGQQGQQGLPATCRPARAARAARAARSARPVS